MLSPPLEISALSTNGPLILLNVQTLRRQSQLIGFLAALRPPQSHVTWASFPWLLPPLARPPLLPVFQVGGPSIVSLCCLLLLSFSPPSHFIPRATHPAPLSPPFFTPVPPHHRPESSLLALCWLLDHALTAIGRRHHHRSPVTSATVVPPASAARPGADPE